MLDPSKSPERRKRDVVLITEIDRVFKASGKRYGADKIWHQLRHEGFDIARCTIERLMKQMEIQGVVRGGKGIKTTQSNKAQPCPKDKVNRIFTAPAPNVLWVADFTYVSTAIGFVYVAFVIDVFARYIVGWKVSHSPNTALVFDALNQGIHARNPQSGQLIHHSDRGVQYLSIKYTEKLIDAGIEPSVGSVGDSYDNALAENMIGLYKTEVIEHQGPWQGKSDVEMATLTWVDWYNNDRLFGPIGYIPPAQAERNFYETLNQYDIAAE